MAAMLSYLQSTDSFLNKIEYSLKMYYHKISESDNIAPMVTLVFLSLIIFFSIPSLSLKVLRDIQYFNVMAFDIGVLHCNDDCFCFYIALLLLWNHCQYSYKFESEVLHMFRVWGLEQTLMNETPVNCCSLIPCFRTHWFQAHLQVTAYKNRIVHKKSEHVCRMISYRIPEKMLK
jgi:hypothetical protein